MISLKKHYKELKRLIKLQNEVNVLKEKKMKRINNIEGKLNLRNCETCTNKKCVMPEEVKPVDYCTYYENKDYKVMIKMKEGLK